MHSGIGGPIFGLVFFGIIIGAGVYLIMSGTGKNRLIEKYLRYGRILGKAEYFPLKEYAGVFGTTYELRVPYGSGIETYSFNGDVDMRAELENITSEDARFTVMVERLKTGLKIHEDTGIRLYDDTADVEIRSIRALDELINEELEYYRETFREYGLKGLMEELFDN